MNRYRCLLSSAVENTCDFWWGIVVFFSISGVATPPMVSMPESMVLHPTATHLHIARQDCTLNRSAHRYRFIGVDVFARLFAEEICHFFSVPTAYAFDR